MDLAGEGLIIHDLDGRMLECNPFACRLLGRDRETLLGLSVGDLESDFDLFQIRQRWLRMRAGDAVSVEGRPRRPDGVQVPVSVRLTCIDDTPGHERFLALLRCEVERAAASSRLEAAQRRFRQLVEHAGDAFFLHDAAGRLLDVNRRACALLGRSREALLSTSIGALEVTLPVDTEATPEGGEVGTGGPVWAELRVGEAGVRESHLRPLSGAPIPVELSTAAVDWLEGRLFIVFARDIRERLETRARLLEKKRNLEMANAELDRFAGVASHDLQAPLRKMRMFSDLLLDEYGAALDEEGREFLEVISKSAGRMQTLVRDLLDYAREGKVTRLKEVVDLNAVVAQVREDLSVHIEEVAAEIRCVPLPSVVGDPLALGRVFQNLLNNALKFRNPQRALRVEIECVRRGSMVRCTVRDNGEGFDPSWAERIFEPFERAHSGGLAPGTGIGLAICRRIIDQLGGSIRAEGRPGEGSSFYLELPVHREGLS